LRDLFGSVMRDARGTTAVEYALIAGLIAVVIAVAVSATGTSVKSLYNSVASII
jgi:pilus assembly protein Flp/PilA